jgi:hypothetical protein
MLGSSEQYQQALDRLRRLWLCLDCEYLFVGGESYPQRCERCGSTQLKHLATPETVPLSAWNGGRLREPGLRKEKA